MYRSAFVFLFLCGTALRAAADDLPRKDAVKQAATEVVDAFVKKDYARVADSTYPAVVAEAGGRVEMIKVVEGMVQKIEKQGFKLTAGAIGEPGEILTEGNNQFVVVPETLDMEFPQGKLIAKSYLLGISSDNGRSWKFMEGAAVAKFGDKLLPKLPAKLKLPDVQRPEFVPNKK